MTVLFDVIYSQSVATNYACNYSLLIPCVPESLQYLSMYDNRCLRYFKGHKQRLGLNVLFSYMKFFTVQKENLVLLLSCYMPQAKNNSCFLLLHHFPFVLGHRWSLIVGLRSQSISNHYCVSSLGGKYFWLLRL